MSNDNFSTLIFQSRKSIVFFFISLKMSAQINWIGNENKMNPQVGFVVLQ